MEQWWNYFTFEAVLNSPAKMMSMSSSQIAVSSISYIWMNLRKNVLCMNSSATLGNHKPSKCWAVLYNTKANKFVELPNTQLLLKKRTKAICAVSKFFVFFFTTKKGWKKQKQKTQPPKAVSEEKFKRRVKIVSAICV